MAPVSGIFSKHFHLHDFSSPIVIFMAGRFLINNVSLNTANLLVIGIPVAYGFALGVVTLSVLTSKGVNKIKTFLLLPSFLNWDIVKKQIFDLAQYRKHTLYKVEECGKNEVTPWKFILGIT